MDLELLSYIKLTKRACILEMISSITRTFGSKVTNMQTSVTAQTLNTLRKDYASPPLHKSDMLSSPFDMFISWFKKAADVEKGLEVNAMNIATVSKDGMPSNRFVLLKEVSDKGFVFYTNYDSKKADEIDENHGKISACFYWPTLNY